ncbi:MAG: sigma-54 dependent transcriptional regulator [Gemmatimonadota bacterium]|nr:MAG: sigma-54 dependent transcriptional regulator [Gemmatimonadota bacterium]
MSQVLIIDDHDSMREGLELLLRKRGHRTLSAEGGEQGLQLLIDEGADLVITDLKMAKVDGMDVLKSVKENFPLVEVLVITAFGTIEKAVEAMKLGAADFITKPFSSEEFGVRIDRLLHDQAERERLRKENVALRVENLYLRQETETRYGEIVGESPAMKDVFRLVDRVARSDSTVIIYGESGTGKELVARAIHSGSPRAGGPFVRVNCGALAEGLLDSELFGHEKGAFTGAEKRRRGRFELADSGTLFLDEISTISPATQVRLLRVLQERELERVGGEETLSVDVRIIVATNTPEAQLVSHEGLRQDLFYRLHVVPITLPPLRDRTGDTALLVEHFIEKLRDRTCSLVSSVSIAAIEALSAYHWPGNVRELENVVERALVLAENEVLQASDIPALGTNGPAQTEPLPDASLAGGGMDLNVLMEGMEERLIREALDQARGVKAEAARLLGLKSSAFYYKLEKYGIDA